MVLMTSKDHVRRATSHSVSEIRNGGQHPGTERIMVSSAQGMIAPVRGRDIRLVSRKCRGKVPKYRYARGPVVSWHEMDRAADSQIYFADRDFLSSFGQNVLSRGYMNAMPVMAAYES